MVLPLAVAWEEVLPAILVTVVAGAVAACWPALQSFHRGRKFQKIIKRELSEIGPHPKEPEEGKPWWEHAPKRFVHQEIFAQENISQNRDFLLSLNGNVVYKVSQLWIALEKREGNQWVEYLKQLSNDRRTKSRELVDAYASWTKIVPEAEQSQGPPPNP